LPRRVEFDSETATSSGKDAPVTYCGLFIDSNVRKYTCKNSTMVWCWYIQADSAVITCDLLCYSLV
jgi:hypothetical protein